jgi:nitrous oxidase accessory protein NosD
MMSATRPRERRIARHLSPILVVLLVVGPLGGASGGPLADLYAPADAERTPHPSISIEGDDDFGDPGSGVRGGSGTADDPYVIGNWTIVQTERFAIRVANTTAHVHIENVSVPGPEGAVTRLASPDCLGSEGGSICGTTGIEIEGAQNVSVENVAIREAGSGIRVSESRDVNVDGLQVGSSQDPQTTGTGASVVQSRSVAMDDVTLRALAPAHVEDAQDVRFRNAEAVGTGSLAALGSEPSDDTVRVRSSENVRFEETVVRDATLDVRKQARNVSVVDSRFVEIVAEEAMQVRGSGTQGLHVCGTVFEDLDVDVALEVVVGGDVEIESNRFAGNPVGVRATANELDVIGNEFHDHSDVGLGARSPDATIHNNSISGNDRGAELSTPADAPTPTDARYNWWGHPSGPSGEGPGSGDPLFTLGEVDVEPWLTMAPQAGPERGDCDPPGSAIGSDKLANVSDSHRPASASEGPDEVTPNTPGAS